MSVPVFSALSEDKSALAPLIWPCCPLQGLTQAEQQQQRSLAISALALMGPGSIPAWEEAAQMAAQLLRMPLAVATLAHGPTEYIRAAYGLSSLGVGNPLSQQRQLPLEQGLGLYILDSEQPLLLPDTTDNPVVAQSQWVSAYGIRAYGGVPLMTSEGICIGTLAVMDMQSRSFSEQELGVLAMAARWGMSEYERQQATSTTATAKLGLRVSPGGQISAMATPPLEALINAVRLNLINQLTQDLRSPLTTVLGMATMLSREIYGPLTEKQREYTDIMCHSSQTLMALVDEILELNTSQPERPDLVPTSVDIATLGQQVITALTPLAEKAAQTLRFTIEPGEHHWILDQRTVKQILYHLIFSIMQVAGDNSDLCVHACRRGEALSLVMWLANPWLGEGLPSEVLTVFQPPTDRDDWIQTMPLPNASSAPQELLGLLLSQHLAQRHGGQIRVQGSADSGCRLAVLLPVLDGAKVRAEATHVAAEVGVLR
ncbi:GAF domain-containing sensor histidine kinase [Nodosilinea sp. E11]|uniref:GAF domain-containing sensor histidine kinase n=1 Tax=Nodosilinea sp. E11 TaxID=3037479 RepID=UPI00293462E2|nr:GAF domain-containing sensor histidine kinase [Nodosilinea sp. E11]WOD40528.1 GAF domain-containing sensor histidine kinase [Nodosilinea sp. E11]